MSVTESFKMMSTNTVIFLNKEREGYKWSYVYANKRYFVLAKGDLLEQTIIVLTHIRDTHDLHDENISVCSTSFHKSVFYDLCVTFPTMKLIPITDSDIARIFHRVMARSVEPTRVRNGNTLFVCSDASKGANSNLCGWAWFSNEAGTKSYNFGVSEQHSIVSAEFEGILHAIIDNADTSHNNIHVYCDSQRSVEFAQAVLAGKVEKGPVTKPMANKRIRKLAEEVVEIATRKNIRIQWVKGHRSHRLNMGADYLSRAARVASERNGRLQKTDTEVAAIMSMFP